MILDQLEEYDAKDVIPFLKGTDMYGDVQLIVSNLVPYYHVTIRGHHFQSSEAAYACGIYSLNTPINISIQKEIEEFRGSGYQAKKLFMVSEKNTQYGRPDMDTGGWNYDWLFYIVWNKFLQNEEFAKLLLSLPLDKMIVENGNKSATGYIWGCRNLELKAHWLKVFKEIENQNKGLSQRQIQKLKDQYRCDTSKHFGKWVGRNVMGKILKQCQLALAERKTNPNAEPNINYDKLNKAEIYWFGEKLVF